MAILFGILAFAAYLALGSYLVGWMDHLQRQYPEYLTDDEPDSFSFWVFVVVWPLLVAILTMASLLIYGQALIPNPFRWLYRKGRGK